MDIAALATDGFGGEALYCVIIAWLSVVSWIIFASVDDADRPRRRRRNGRGGPVFIGAAGFCDGSGSDCDGGYGICGTCFS